MSNDRPLPAALAIDSLPGDARAAFDVASESRYGGISFPTNHAELTPDALSQSARRHLKTILNSKQLGIDAIRVAAPRAGLSDPSSIDRTLEQAQKAFLLAADLGVTTVSLNVGELTDAKTPAETILSALRELAQHADANGLTLALGAGTIGPLAGLLKRVDYERARMNFDTARLIGGSEDALKTAEYLGETIGQVTLADAVRAGSALRTTFLGEGQLALPELMGILSEQGFRGPFVVDVREVGDPAAGAAHAAKVLRRLLQG